MRKGEAEQSVGVSCRDFVPPEKAKPFQVVQAGGVAENPRAFGGASRHAREHKTPTEGTAHGIHRSVPGNPLFRHSKFFPFSRKGCCPSTEKVFGSTPFSKGVAGCRAGSPARMPDCKTRAKQKATYSHKRGTLFKKSSCRLQKTML